jgi:hypothetical protein
LTKPHVASKIEPECVRNSGSKQVILGYLWLVKVLDIL